MDSNTARIFTGEYDLHKTPIFVGDVLYNPFIGDVWDVVMVDGTKCEAWLIPNSGTSHHEHPVYPMHIEQLCDVAGSFEIIKDVPPWLFANNKRNKAK